MQIYASGDGSSSAEQSLRSVSATVANLFPLWLIIAAAFSLWRPGLFLWFQKDYVTAGLALTMLSMGTSLTLEVAPSYIDELMIPKRIQQCSILFAMALSTTSSVQDGFARIVPR